MPVLRGCCEIYGLSAKVAFKRHFEGGKIHGSIAGWGRARISRLRSGATEIFQAGGDMRFAFRAVVMIAVAASCGTLARGQGDVRDEATNLERVRTMRAVSGHEQMLSHEIREQLKALSPKM